MKSKVKSHAGRRAKGAAGEREAAHAIEKNCPGLRADRAARNGKRDTDILVWQRGSPERVSKCEVKRVESLDIGTKAMEKIREQSKADGAIGVLWRRNGRGWALEVLTQAHTSGKWRWATYSGDSVWGVLSEIVGGT